MTQIGAYAPGELEFLIEHDDTVLLELDTVTVTYTQPKAPGGSGLGRLHHRYHKRTGPATGTWAIDRKLLAAADKGDLFRKLLTGAGIIITELITTPWETITTGEPLAAVIQIKLVVAGTVLELSDDYTVNYATDTITFNTALTADAEIKYLSDHADWRGANLLQNSTLEDVITGIWTALGGAAVARTAGSKYVGTYGLAITSVSVQDDGAQYDPNIAVIPARTYRFSFWAKSSAADTPLVVSWQDVGGNTPMTAVGTAATLSVTWKLHEFTFTPDEATILYIQIEDNQATPSSTWIYVDEVYLREDDPSVDLLEAGLLRGFEFNILARRTIDGVVVARIEGCQIYDGQWASGEFYTESINGQFLRLLELSV